MKTKDRNIEFIANASKAIESAGEGIMPDLTDLQKTFKRLTKYDILQHALKQREQLRTAETTIAELQTKLTTAINQAVWLAEREGRLEDALYLIANNGKEGNMEYTLEETWELATKALEVKDGGE